VNRKRLLVVAHAPSPNTQALLQAVLQGARSSDVSGVGTTSLTPFAAGPEDVLQADAVILGTPENLGYMSGALKDFFDRIYYPCLERTQGLGYALWVRAGSDGTGTRRAVESITAGLRWRAVSPPLICRGEFQPSFIDDCRELGLLVAASVEAGII
jgi:multimeric flavodoxin WrbA